MDAAAYLTARLFDLFVGDWDRHADQWSWARFDEGKRHRWVPIPRDRDWALTRLDGPLYGLLRLYLPKYQSFGETYGSVYGLTLSAEALDRRLLAGLSRPTWDSVTAELQLRLTDEAIDNAVARLPPEYQGKPTRELAWALRLRRDRLPAVAATFYHQLAGTVEVRGTDADELLRVERLTDGSATVRVTPVGGREPVYSRRFSPQETGEVRVYLRGGSDSVWFDGSGPQPIKVRVVRGPGAAPVADSTEVDISPVLIPRDWGHLWSVAPWVEAAPEVGLLVGGGPVLYRYGFRRFPYQSRLALRLGYATGAARPNLDLTGDFRFQRPDVRVTLYAAALGADLVRYYGLGNETVVQGEGSFHRVVARELVLQPGVEWEVVRDTVLGVGAMAKSLITDLDQANLLALERPYGSGSFAEAGARLLARYDTRDDPVYPTSGVRLSATAQYFPALFDVSGASGRCPGWPAPS